MKKNYELVVFDLQGFSNHLKFNTLEEAIKRSHDFYGDPFTIIEKTERAVSDSEIRKAEMGMKV